MSKSTRMTPEQLRSMNLEEVEPGKYRPKTKKDHPISELQQKFKDELREEESRHKKGLSNFISTLDEYYNITPEMYKSVDELWNPKPKPFDIASIRALGSGTKARKQSMDHLHQFAKSLVENRDMDSIYIKGNVASSKNSKEIAKFKKKVMGKTVEMTSLIDSKATRAYRTETSRQWGAHLQHFKDIVKGKQYPLSIHFTFIRKTLGRFDLLNAAQGPLDIMVEKGYIEDDSSEHVIPVFNPVVYYSKEYAGLLIKVL